MKKLIFLAAIISQPAFAACKVAPDMGDNFYRCENKEGVCYILAEKHLANSPMPISCFKK
jgi:hypothetical protein